MCMCLRIEGNDRATDSFPVTLAVGRQLPGVSHVVKLCDRKFFITGSRRLQRISVPRIGESWGDFQSNRPHDFTDNHCGECWELAVLRCMGLHSGIRKSLECRGHPCSYTCATA